MLIYVGPDCGAHLAGWGVDASVLPKALGDGSSRERRPQQLTLYRCAIRAYRNEAVPLTFSLFNASCEHSQGVRHRTRNSVPTAEKFSRSTPSLLNASHTQSRQACHRMRDDVRGANTTCTRIAFDAIDDL